MVLQVKFFPGVPDKFEKSFKIQVAHFEPETITIFCEGIFPRICLDLPRYSDPEGHYKNLSEIARDNLTSLPFLKQSKHTGAAPG
ncbi:HYDIN [Bugula neritina]|uniref:HYDIN n=1 Tax=Bugula neritina TaxID=10212 RepID=A0A7J7K178_BUGNE|nr:HYDIN [Bugula neritina]